MAIIANNWVSICHILFALKDAVHIVMLKDKIVKTRGPAIMFLLAGTE